MFQFIIMQNNLNTIYFCNVKHVKNMYMFKIK